MLQNLALISENQLYTRHLFSTGMIASLPTSQVQESYQYQRECEGGLSLVVVAYWSVSGGDVA